MRVSYLRIAAAGLILLAGLAAGLAGRAAPGGDIAPVGPPVLPDPNATSAANAPQPIVAQALDATHFVVVTREPRLITRVGGDGRYVNMVLPVVTYYVVQNGRLVPMEHVHVPEGWRPLSAP